MRPLDVQNYIGSLQVQGRALSLTEQNIVNTGNAYVAALVEAERAQGTPFQARPPKVGPDLNVEDFVIDLEDLRISIQRSPGAQASPPIMKVMDTGNAFVLAIRQQEAITKKREDEALYALKATEDLAVSLRGLRAGGNNVKLNDDAPAAELTPAGEAKVAEALASTSVREPGKVEKLTAELNGFGKVSEDSSYRLYLVETINLNRGVYHGMIGAAVERSTKLSDEQLLALALAGSDQGCDPRTLKRFEEFMNPPAQTEPAPEGKDAAPPA